MLVGRSHVGKIQKESFTVGGGGVKNLRTGGVSKNFRTGGGGDYRFGGLTFAGQGQLPITCHERKNELMWQSYFFIFRRLKNKTLL